MTTITAKSILASRHAVTGDRLDTLLLRYPRAIHAEFMTHRVFSRNAASSRAIPVEKLIAAVESDPFVPLVWTRNEPGMQGRETLTPEEEERARLDWSVGNLSAVSTARKLAGSGCHKQIVNRVLEPFSHITVVCSATNWSNFLHLRDHKDAEPHIQMLAREARAALAGASVQELQPGAWHLPFVGQNEFVENSDEDCIKLSVARCASTSYKTVDGFDMTLARAVALHDKLISADPIHASPLEHVAQADTAEINRLPSGIEIGVEWAHGKQHRNFAGFRQYRAIVEDAR